MTDRPLPRLEVLEGGSAFLALAGLRFTHMAADRVEATIELGPQHHTPFGIVHGGVFASAVETAASVGATTS